MFNKILLAYDGSVGSKLAFEKAAEIAKLVSTGLHILAVGRIPEYAETVSEVNEAREQASTFYSKIMDEAILAPAPSWIPIFYAIAMGADALAALLLGRLFDRVGLSLLIVTSLACAFFPTMVFFGSFPTALLGMVLWGVGIGVQESIMRAVIAGIVSADKRATAYGIFNAGFGCSGF